MFNQATRQGILPVGAFTYSAGGTESKAIPNVGLLSKIFGVVKIVFTTSGAGTFANKTSDIPTPYMALKRIRVATNEGQAVYETSGWGNYLIQRTLRSSYDPRNPLTSFGATNVAALVNNLPSSYSVSTQYTIRFPVVIPIAWEESLQAGLILMQNLSTRLNLELTYGDIATELLTLGGGGTITVNSVTFSPHAEIFALPADPNNHPDLSMVHLWTEETQPIVSNGDNTYRPGIGPIYLGLIQEFINNSARIDPASITSRRLSVAQLQTPYNITPENQLLLQRIRLGGIDLPDGVFYDDFSFGSGLPELGNTRDVIDTSQLTDIAVITQLASTLTISGTAYIRTLREILVPNVG